MNVNLKSLIGKLNPVCRNALDAAAGHCMSETHYNVEVEHLLAKLNEVPDTDLDRIYKHYEIDRARLSKDLSRALENLKRGNARTPTLSPRIPRCITEAWQFASIEYGETAIRSGHLLLALLSDENLSLQLRETSKTLAKIPPEELFRNLAKLTAESGENTGPSEPESTEVEEPTATPAKARSPALDQYTIDLTLRAKQGKIDPVLGRDFEIRQMVDILTRRRQNNPILTGEAGVGKTAVAEGLALRIAAGDVPPPLLKVALKSLDLTLLQAGAGIKGEFENRLKSVIEEVKASPQPIILFIDEAHTLIGAGNQAGQGDAANILKPALARGELRTIAATTWSEYKKYFEKDAALTRRFQVVKVEEPTEMQTVSMLRGLAETLERHHNVRILDEAMDSAARLSHRYITGRQLPDKAVSVLDTASARVALGQMTMPAALEDCQRQLDLIATETRILERENLTGGDFHERLEAMAQEKAKIESLREELEKQWAEEKRYVEELRSVREKLEAHALAAKQGASENVDGRLPEAEVTRLREDLTRLGDELSKVQGDRPLIQVCVDGQAVAEVVSSWTGIPVGKVVKDEIQTVLTLKDRLEERVIGQAHALDAISQRIRTSRAKLEDPRRPIGVFMLVGPSGVGKTETALALADALFGGERNLVTINMSEYQEAHTVSGLKGSPPGYVGYGEGGILTEAVRRKPYSIVLLDEIEKAHTDVTELFYQVFDKGMLEDAEGREVDFKNTIILMTSNVGTDTIMKFCRDGNPDAQELAEYLRPDLLRVFKPAFLGRAIVVPYYPIADDIMRRIIELQLGRIQKRIGENHRAQFTYDPALIEAVAERCTEVESGARNVDHILTRTLLPELSGELLSRMASGQPVTKIHVTVGENGNFQYEIS